jgi:ATP-binding cassette subfamily B protein
MLIKVAPALAAAAVLLLIADALLPNLVIVVMGRAAARIPPAVEHGIDGPLERALALAGVVYALSLLRAPAQSALGGIVQGRMTPAIQNRMVAAVARPAGVAHLEDPEIADRLAGVSGELRGDRLADAPMTVLAQWGDRLGGVVSCLILMTFKVWVGALLLVVWLAVRKPSRAFVVSRINTFRRAAPALRQAGYLLRLASSGPSAKEVRVFEQGDYLIGRYRARWLEAMRPSWAALRPIQRDIALLALVVFAAYVAAAAALARDADLKTLATMLPMLPMSMQLGTVSALEVQLAGMLAGLPDLDALERDLQAPEGAPTRDGHEDIRFHQVRFAYTEPEVLKGIDLTLPKGTSLGLVGLNGAGKSTLIALLCGLYEPTSGTITGRSRVALVSQEPLKLPLTVAENVAMGNPIDRAKLERAAERAGAKVADWDAILNPRYSGGVDLSGGEWQRLALARALYAVEFGARVLVLDEPTAQLDVRGEAAFYDRFLELVEGTTSIVISHRFSTVRRADRIAVLADGRITELGSHDELLAVGGEYARMFHLQAEAFKT